ncbi:NAD(P)/FAD-dependent oxidoreductase [Salinithrix halophila]|uniref:NAD(P)/FAD-dependent oxidoreductase n=1 Tax=Salinithrix halophila TaxID=1485204 RepID=A0ABV8JEV0_9BACL
MTDVLIIGAGPAGLTAAIACAEHRLNVRVLDEFIKPGGRLLGQLHEEPDGTWWNGMKEAQQLYEKATSLGVRFDCSIPVAHLERINEGWRVHTQKYSIDVPRVLLATGAAESPVPIPGWTLPGVMSIGAAQVMTNVHRVPVGERGLIVGINVLSVAIARELTLAGIGLTGMFLPGINPAVKDAGNPRFIMQSLLRVSHLSPSRWIRWGRYLMNNEPMQSLGLRLYPKSGVKMWGIPIHLRKAVLEIVGDQQVQGVNIADVSPDGTPIPGTEKTLPVDFVCIAGSLYPLVELAAVAGCPFHYASELGGHVPVHNRKMETPLKGLYVAGSITGVEGAKVAMAQGTVAGLSIVDQVNPHETLVKEQLERSLQRVEEERDRALIQFRPHIKKARRGLEHTWNNTPLHM